MPRSCGGERRRACERTPLRGRRSCAADGRRDDVLALGHADVLGQATHVFDDGKRRAEQWTFPFAEAVSCPLEVGW
jgi:hypothetical protein